MNIGGIVDFIEGQNYHGEVYHQKRLMQIEGSKYWIKRFFPQSSDFSKNKKQIEKETMGTYQYFNSLAKIKL